MRRMTQRGLVHELQHSHRTSVLVLCAMLLVSLTSSGYLLLVSQPAVSHYADSVRDAIDDPDARRERYDELVATYYERGKALSVATVFEIDDVIEPADTRRWIMAILASAPEPLPRAGKKRPNIDTW